MGGGNGKSTENRVTDLINNVRKNASSLENDIEKLAEIESEWRQGHARKNSQRNRNDLPKGSVEECLRTYRDWKKTFMNQLDSLQNGTGENKQGKPSPEGSATNSIEVGIQLYCPQETYLTDYAVQELETKLISHQFQNGMKLAVQTCKTRQDIKSGIPLIVICLSSSRLGVDYIDAVSKIPTGSDTAVLIFHHLQQHALPTQASSITLKGAEFKNVGIIIDVAFFEDMGLYECDMNINAYEELIAFIESRCRK